MAHHYPDPDESLSRPTWAAQLLPSLVQDGDDRFSVDRNSDNSGYHTPYGEHPTSPQESPAMENIPCHEPFDGQTFQIPAQTFQPMLEDYRPNVSPSFRSYSSLPLPPLQGSRAEFESASEERRRESRESREGYEDNDALHENGLISDDQIDVDEETSEADSDYADFEAEMAKLKKDVLKFKASRLDPARIEEDDSSDDGCHTGSAKIRKPPRKYQPMRSGRQKRGIIHTGPRRAATPTGDIKLRLGKATDLFMEAKYPEAAEVLQEIVRINSETYEAWTLMSAVFQEMGILHEALISLIFAAHLRPRYPSAWMLAGKFALDETEDPERYLPEAEFCWSQAIRANPKGPDVLNCRYKKAEIFVHRGKLGSAITEYKRILVERPRDTETVRNLASVCIDRSEEQTAIEIYKALIAELRSKPWKDDPLFSWTDVDTYLELYMCIGQYGTVIRELKSLARWMVGREAEDVLWDAVDGNDCEWDVLDARRLKVNGFTQGRYTTDTYGEGLPFELRVKFVLCRLRLGNQKEAMLHFDLLDAFGNEEQNIADYPHLFREIADQLFDSKYYQKALQLYRPLKDLPDGLDCVVLLCMGRCLLHEKDDKHAEEHFLEAVKLDDKEVNARMELAKLYEGRGDLQKALNYANEAMLIRRVKLKRPAHRGPYRKRKPKDSLAELIESDVEPQPDSKIRENKASCANHQQTVRTGKKRRVRAERNVEVLSEAERLSRQYTILRQELTAMREGDEVSTAKWMDAARELTDDFRSFRTFYPWDKYMKFLGYSNDDRAQAEISLDSDLSAMAERLSKGLGADVMQGPKVELPTDYRGIPFNNWLDIFMDYALCLARNGFVQESYELCDAAKDANVFYQSRRDMFLIQLSYCMCALLSNDEEKCLQTVRWFTKTYQFTTDAYRMFAALMRCCQSPVSWYSSGPSQKYVLRQIKAMDFSLTDEKSRKRWYRERGSYSAMDENGHIIINDDLDIALLVLYGQLLFTGTSYTFALNYYFRALALDPENPMICLNIGLAYIHQALKRQHENRQHSILQGLTFMRRYYDSRKSAEHVEERQEAHYNMGRCYHMLGLSHLAIPYYYNALDVSPDQEGGMEDLALDAAYNLQTIYTAAGNMRLAEEITRKWLVI